jgi:TonB family protein
MIMMTRKQFRTSAIMKLLIVIPLSAAFIIAVSSCAASKKAAKTHKEVSQSPPSEVFVVVEEMPKFPGGDDALMKFINSNVVYPKTAKDKNIQGRVIIRFVVGADGTVRDPQVLRAVDPELDAEAVRVIKSLPKFQPGKQGGKVVSVYYSIPITFALAPLSQMNMPRYMLSGSDTIWVRPEENPSFSGGSGAAARFKDENLKYPDAALSNMIGGTVSVQFIVNENGSLTDLTVSSGVCPSLDAEALRVARLMPPWQPGKEKGRIVKVRSGASFNFSPPSTGIGIAGELPTEVFVVVQEMPVFPGGDSTLMKFINSNLQYPKNAKEKNIQGRVILRFCVTYEGKIAQVGVLRGVDPELDQEAIRVIKMLPLWKPGRQGGKPVNVWYSVPVTFALPMPPNQPALTQGVQSPPPPIPPSPPSPATPPVYLLRGYDESPLFPGGDAALFKFIQTNILYPDAAKKEGKTGKVIISFTITETGALENVNIRESVDPLLDAEALRVVKLLQGWQPAKLKSTPVRVSYTIPVNFTLR